MLLAAFDSREVEGPRQFARFYEAVASQIGRMTPRPPADRSAFPTCVAARRLGDRVVSTIAAPGHDAARTARDIAADPAEAVHLTLMTRGARGIGTHGREASVAAGGLFLAASWRPFTLRDAGRAYAGVKLILPAAPALRTRLDRYLTARGPALEGALAPVVKAACLAAGRGLDRLDDIALAGLLGAVERLLDATLADDAREADSDGLSDTAAGLAALARAEIAERVGDHELTLAALSRRLGVSSRRVQRALCDSGEPFSAALRAARMTQARRRLEAGPGTIQQIAWDCGYRELSAFYRAFRRAHGCAPGAVRPCR